MDTSKVELIREALRTQRNQDSQEARLRDLVAKAQEEGFFEELDEALRSDRAKHVAIERAEGNVVRIGKAG
jgi:DNA-binding FadR family transcriptional regulator